MFKRIVAGIELLAVVAFALMVVLLFVRQPANHTALPTPAAAGSNGAPAAPDGAQLYRTNCASCHGADGGGGIGPQLSGGKVTKSFSDAPSEVSFVQAGTSRMPGFKSELTDAEVQALVDFTRTTLQSK